MNDKISIAIINNKECVGVSYVKGLDYNTFFCGCANCDKILYDRERSYAYIGEQDEDFGFRLIL